MKLHTKSHDADGEPCTLEVKPEHEGAALLLLVAWKKYEEAGAALDEAQDRMIDLGWHKWDARTHWRNKSA